MNKTIQIQNKVISAHSKTFVIAEAGVNHGGDMNIAKKLIDIACEAGADAVKFQTFKAEHLILRNVNKAPYQNVTTDSNESQFEMLKKLEVTRAQNHELKNYCNAKKIIFLTTPFDEYSLDELDELDLPAYKIASTDLTNIPFLRKVAKRKKPIFLSTGMSYLQEIIAATQAIAESNQDLILLQCSANYPIKDIDANLGVINTFRRHFDGIIGYSDHSVGLGAAPYSVVLGAKVVEKHFTIDKAQEGPDHLASLSPKELINLVIEIRKVESFLGTGIKEPSADELGTRKFLQKCFVAIAPIKKGEQFTDENIRGKRTGGIGISPLFADHVFHQTADRDFKIDEIIDVKLPL